MPGRICVFCGSNFGSAPVYREIAAQVGQLIVSSGYGVVYGGGHVGLMGVVADAAFAAGGEVIGVIPIALHEREVAHTGISELIITQTMHERKARMAELSDAFLALPGGLGTFEELFEILTWRQLLIHDKRIGVLNANAYFDPLITLLDHAVNEGFVSPAHKNLLRIDSDAQRLIEELTLRV